MSRLHGNVLILAAAAAAIHGLQFVPHPDINLSTKQMVNKYGFKYERHVVTTIDGYLITMFRIPGSLNSTSPNRHPIMLVPGTCGCSENFVVSGPEHGIAFFLARRGFDVWLANTRGNRHARRHNRLSPESREFWDFGWHEVAVYDTPALIDYVLNATGKENLLYVGHSRGVTSFLAFAAELVEYNKKIKLSIQMAPSCFLNKTRTYVKVLGKHASLIQSMTNDLELYELFPKRLNNFINSLLKTICSELTVLVDLCLLIVYNGQYSNGIDPSILQLALKSSPAGCSIKELAHYFQIAYSGYFRQFDYGPRLNFKQYGSITPPNYNLSNINSPIALFYSMSDSLVPVEGVQQLKASLPKLVMSYEVPRDDFYHADFIFGQSAASLVYEPMFELLKKYVLD